ncbi:MAG TPA: thioredoxin family protein [Myxococcales bacterium]|nr:thioredoxin family protein [Myxococcales bacterium]
MARTPSTMLPLGTKTPDFSLTNTVDGRRVSLSDFNEDRGLLVMFICNHCPFVVHLREELVHLANHFVEQGFGVVAINSNSDQSHPQDGPENMASLAREEEWNFPFLFDAEQEVVKAFSAACTPDFFIFNGDQELVYRGQMDDSRPGSGIPVSGRDLSAAMEAVLAGEAVSAEQKPSLGCNIKWHAGNEPNYFA